MPTEGWTRGGPPPHWSGLSPWPRRLLAASTLGWTTVPWALLSLAGAAVAWHRWPGWMGVASATICLLAASVGGRVLWAAAVRGVDVAVAEAITEADIADPDPWGLFPQREEIIKVVHSRPCLRRHGVNPRSSGWAHLAAGSRLRGGMELACALLLCAPVALHPWWL